MGEPLCASSQPWRMRAAASWSILPARSASRVLAGGIERSVGLGSGEALVPEVDSEGGMFWAGGIAGRSG